jgi:hypothetical protein
VIKENELYLVQKMCGEFTDGNKEKEEKGKEMEKVS